MKDFSGIRNSGALPSPIAVQIPDDIDDLLEDYIDSTNSTLNELEQVTLAYESSSNREENAAAARRLLHKIKGESSMVGIDEIAALCHQAEDAFEELTENECVDMLLRFKDWVYVAVCNMAAHTKT